MPTLTSHDAHALSGAPGERAARLQQALEHAAHFLPSQGPITAFVHHNPLHMFEDLPFDEAVKKASRIYNCQPYWPEPRFRQEMSHGRIRSDDLRACLHEDLGAQGDELVAGLVSRYALRLTMLEYPVRLASPAELRWFVAETDALRRYRSDAPAEMRERFLETTRHWVMRDLRPNGHAPRGAEAKLQAALADLFARFGADSIESWSEPTWEAFGLQTLWRICRRGVHGIKAATAPKSGAVRPRDLLLEATGSDSDVLVHSRLIPFTAAFLDQGFATWQLPRRESGFFSAFVALYGLPGGPPDRWLHGLAEELARQSESKPDPLGSILQSLDALGVEESQWEEFLTASLLALRGWAGMIRQTELRADRLRHPSPPGSQVEYLAVQLLLERFALAHLARKELGYTGPLARLRQALPSRSPQHHELHNVDQRAFLVFQLAQVLGLHGAALHQLSKSQWTELVEEIETFSGLERRRVFQQAFERRYRTQALDAVALHAARGEEPSTATPRLQAIFCIDDREESFRRHLEEISDEIETFSAAGFYAVPMYYRGAADAQFAPLCPAILTPQHWVAEEAAYPLQKAHQRRAATRRYLGAATQQVHLGSRTFAGGALLSTVLGPLASVPLVARILFPRLTSRIRRTAGRLVQPPPWTQLQLERQQSLPGPGPDHLGFTVDEMATSAELMLRECGLTKRFARLVVVTGHGSSSLNNPHEAAYNCGACAGGRGGPNARAFARMANDPRVRQRLARAGVPVPDETYFIGAYHNTCDESVTYFDLDRLPASHRADFDLARAQIDRARERNAHERCRRFESVPLAVSAEAALRHVERRAEDLAQTRPEYNHATSALGFVGRRSRTRGLFFDRRVFLTSYDPTDDDEQGSTLARVLKAAIPVCAGISLEYYFSSIDPAGWGCGNKLPHNVTSLLGVMEGAAGDLRPGLSNQMIEIHEPMRILFIIECTPEMMGRMLEGNEGIRRLCYNDWIQLATLSPTSGDIHFFRQGEFERYKPESDKLPRARASVDWYRGWRDHLGFAQIDPRLAGAQERGTSRGKEKVS